MRVNGKIEEELRRVVRMICVVIKKYHLMGIWQAQKTSHICNGCKNNELGL